MKSKGIRILDKKENIVCVELSDIFEEIQDGKEFNWSILYIDAIGHLKGRSISDFEDEIIESDRGLFITWDELNQLSKKLREIYGIIVLGDANKKSLRRYQEDQEMYETCDVVIEIVDSAFWQVFSKDASLIDRLSKKFKEIEFLEPDFKR